MWVLLEEHEGGLFLKNFIFHLSKGAYLREGLIHGNTTYDYQNRFSNEYLGN